MDGLLGGVFASRDEYPPAWISTNLLEAIDEERSSRRDDDLPQSGSASKRLRTGFECDHCGKLFTEKRSLARHNRYAVNCKLGEPSQKPFACTICSKDFTRDDVRQRHENEKHYNLKRRQRGLGLLANLRIGSTDRSTPRDIAPRTPSAQTRGLQTMEQSSAVFENSAIDHSWRGDHMSDTNSSSPSPEVGAIGESIDGSDVSSSNSSSAHRRRWSSSAESNLSIGSSIKLTSPNTSFTTFGSDTDRLSAAETCGSANRISQDEECRSTRHVSFELPCRLDLFKGGARTRPASHRTVQVCPLCCKSFGTTIDDVLSHFKRHSLQFEGQHQCEKCQIGFVHKADLKLHLASVTRGSCGLQFEHMDNCTGHHPPSSSDCTLSDHDRAKLLYCVRDWEQSQLRDYRVVVNTVISDLGSSPKSDDCWSIDGALRKSMQSLSIHFSGRDVRSTPEYVERHVRKAYSRMRRSVSNRVPFDRDASFQVKLGKKLAKVDRLGVELAGAAASGNVPKMQELLLRGAPINGAYTLRDDFADCTPLMAAVCSRSKEAVEFLLENEAKVDGSNSLDEVTIAPPLCLAAANGDIDIVRCLLEHDAKINKQAQKYGGHAACYAARNGHAEVLSLLLNQGADIHLHASVELFEGKPIDQSAPLSSANILGIAVHHDRLEAVKMLLERPELDFDYCDTSAALAIAAYQGNLAIINLLWEAHPQLCSYYALWIAASQGHKAVVDAFIDQQKRIKPRLPLQSTKALQRASRRGQGDLPSLMLSPHEGPHELCDLDMFACRNFESNSAYILIEQPHSTTLSKEALNFAMALNCAVYYNALNAARVLLDHGVHPETEIYPSNLRILATNLSLAARLGLADMVRLLLLYGANPSPDGHLSLDVLEAALEGGCVDTLRSLFQSGSTFLPRQDEWSCSSFNAAVIKAVKQGQTQLLKALIDGGINVNQSHFEDGSNRPTTLLHIAAGCLPSETSYQTIKVLLESGADPRSRTASRTASDVMYMRWMSANSRSDTLSWAQRMVDLMDLWERRIQVTRLPQLP